MESLGLDLDNYQAFAYIDLEIFDHLSYDKDIQNDAGERGWKYKQLKGDIRLLHMLVNADWSDADFLHLKSGYRIEASNDNNIIRAVPVQK